MHIIAAVILAKMRFRLAKCLERGNPGRVGTGWERDTPSQLLASGYLERASGLGATATMGSERGRRLQTRVQEYLELLGGAKAWRGSGSCQGRGAGMCMVGERHLNIVGMKDKFKTHQMELRQNDNVRSMSHSF